MAIRVRTRLKPRVPWLVLGAIALAACGGGKSKIPEVKNEEPPPGVANIVRMNDPAVARQLVNGFYATESNAWRWTAGKFTILLGTPPGAGQRGAVLTLTLNVPDPVIKAVGPVALTASIGGNALGTTVYSIPGSYVYRAEVPATLCTGDSVKAEFNLDKSMPPSASDRRELGIVATVATLSIR